MFYWTFYLLYLVSPEEEGENMAEKNNKRVYAGYYNRYDGKLIYVVMVTTDIDSGEKLVLCQYADYTNTGKYYTVTKQSFCEQVEWRGQTRDLWRCVRRM